MKGSHACAAAARAAAVGGLVPDAEPVPVVEEFEPEAEDEVELAPAEAEAWTSARRVEWRRFLS